MVPVEPYAAVILAGGAGRRLGGGLKPAAPVAGRPMLHRVLEAVADASWRVVVGPPELPLPAGPVIRTRERPPGGGPVAATAAGLAALPAGGTVVGAAEPREVALLAADLPLLTADALRRLRLGVGSSGAGAVFVDDTGRPQWLCGVWRTRALRERLARLPPDLAGVSLRDLLGGLTAAHLTAGGAHPPPWWDCDTEADLRQAEQWAGQWAGSGPDMAEEWTDERAG